MTATAVLSAAHAPTLPSGPCPDLERPIAVAAFDVGETLIDETRIWSRWADRLGVTRLSFLGVLGAMAAAGAAPPGRVRAVPSGHRPRRRDRAVGRRRPVRPARELRRRRPLPRRARRASPGCARAGIGVVIAGNQPPQARAALDAMDLGVDRDPDLRRDRRAQAATPEFFAAVAERPASSRRRSPTSATASTTTSCRPAPRRDVAGARPTRAVGLPAGRVAGGRRGRPRRRLARRARRSCSTAPVARAARRLGPLPGV